MMSTPTTSKELTMQDPTTLHLSTVDVKPIQVDWSGTSDRDDYSEPLPYWQTFDYESDDETTYTLVASGSSTVAVVIDGTAYASWDDYADAWRDEHGGDDDDATPDAVTEETFDALLEVEPYMYGAEGPMMNYWYPIEESDGPYRDFDAVAAAVSVADLPLCVAEIDGEYGLALTGGGMDLSWEICAGFVALGKLPPVHFRDLPAYAGEWSDRNEVVYHAMRRSLEVSAGWMTRGVERLDELRTRQTRGA